MTLLKAFVQFEANTIYRKSVLSEEKLEYARVYVGIYEKCYETHKIKWRELKTYQIMPGFCLIWCSNKPFCTMNT